MTILYDRARVPFFSAIILTALCYFFGTGFNNVWILAWFAPLPVLLFGLYAKKTLQVFIVSFLAYALGSLNIFYYFHYLPHFIFIPIFISYSFISALFFACIILFSCHLIKKRSSGWSVFFFPCLLTCYEFVLSNFSAAGTLDSMSYSQMKFLPILQMASVSGIWGISFILALVPSSTAVAWYRRKDKKALFISLFFPACIVLLALSFGVFRLSNNAKIGSIKIGLLAVPESFQNLISSNEPDAKLIAKRFLKEVPELKRQGAEIVVMSEKMITTKASYYDDILGLFKNTAKKNRVMLVFGINQIGHHKKLNTAYAVSKKGTVIAEYHKQHMLPGAETGYIEGKKLSVFSIRRNLAGIIICKDADFINPARQYSQKGIGLLFVPALDFDVDGWLHASPAIMRGIEGGYSVVRSAQWGLLTVTDQYGHVLAKKKTSNKQNVSLVVNTPIYSGKTFYSRGGDWFVVISFIVCILTLFI